MPVRRWAFNPGWGVTIAAAVMAGVFVPGQPAWAVPDVEVEAGSESAEPELDRGPDGLQAPDAASALTIARLEGERVEVLGERTETSSTWALPDGTLTMGRAVAPVWVPQGDGDGTAAADWAPVDLTLVVTPEGDVAPVSYPAELTLAGGGVPEDGKLVTLAGEEGAQVSVVWTEELPEPRLEGPRATYEDVQPGVDLVVEATRTGYEQFFVLTEAPGDPAALDLSLQVRTEGLETTPDEDGGVLFTNAEGDVLGHSGTPLVWDAEVDAQRAHPISEPFVTPPAVEGVLSSGLPAVPDYGPPPAPGEPSTTELDTGAQLDTEATELPLPEEALAAPEVPEGAGQATDEAAVQAEASTPLPLTEAADIVAPGAVDLEMLPDAEFLADPETVYPVVVDPDAYFNWGFDTFVQTGYNSDQSGSGELRLGTYDGGANVARSFINFYFADVRQKLILDARLDLYMTHSYSCQARNWEVWDTQLAGNGTRWNAQPGWVNRQATLSATTGYGAGCDDGWVSANLTGLMQAWSNGNYTDVALGLRAENERDTYGWKKFNSADAGWGIPAMYVRWNTPPGPAGAPGVSPMNFDNGPWSNGTTPRLSAVVNDVDGAASLFFEVRRASDGGVVWSGWTGSVPNGSVGFVDVPPNVLVSGESYYMLAHTYDGIQWNTGYSQSGVWTIDQSAPAAPAVASAAYPSDQTWHGAENQAGDFTLTLPAADSTLSGYEWALDAPPSTKLAATGNATLSVTPPTNGVHVLQVRSIDRAGNRSQIVKYSFNVGRAGVVSPIEGAQVVRKVQLTVTSETAFTHAQYWWRRGPDATESFPIDIGALTKPDGSPLTSWSARTGSQTVSTFEATWDASLTLGDVPGPVQVSARVGTDATGAAAYQTAWTSVTVSPDASYAATDSVGPGTVNLLTGDYSLSATDVDEFGLALGRTASSRDPRAGFELQPEVLPEATQTVTDPGLFSGNAVTVQKATNRWHRGNSSLLLTATGATADSFAIANTALPLRKGATYRISAWVYVPAATGLNTDDNAWAQRLNVFWPLSGGGYEHKTSTRAQAANTWQQISMDVTIPAAAGGDGQFRLYNGSGTNGAQVFFDDISVREIWAPLGPQWSLGTADGTTDTAYTSITQPYPDVAKLNLSGGGEIWFTEGSGGRWWPEPGAEGLTLTQTIDQQWRLAELDGTVSMFAVGTTSVLKTDYQLYPDQSLTSTNGAFRLSMQSDGNLVIYQIDLTSGNITPIWALSWMGVTPVAGSRLVMQGDGNLVVYNSNYSAAIWHTYSGAPVNGGSRLVMQSDGNLVIYRPDNTYTWNSATRMENLNPSDTVARLISSSPPAATGQTRLMYESVNGRMRLTRLIAPIQPGVDNWPTNTAACTTATPAAGCQVQELVYATGGTPSSTTSSSFGNYADRLVEVKLWSSTPTQAMNAVSVVRYAYDDQGMLREVWDPRISPNLKTAYTYDGAGRVIRVSGAGELPWRFTYGTGGSRSTVGNGDLIDRSSGRLLSVTRASLQAGSTNAIGPDNTSTIVYSVPLSRAAGGPYDLNAAALATWAQTRGPTDATAIFGPEDVPSVTTEPPRHVRRLSCLSPRRSSGAVVERSERPPSRRAGCRRSAGRDGGG